MNAQIFHTELTALVQRAVNEGIAEGKLGFQTAIGIIDDAKQSIYEWRQNGRLSEMMATMMGGEDAARPGETIALLVDPKTGKAVKS